MSCLETCAPVLHLPKGFEDVDENMDIREGDRKQKRGRHRRADKTPDVP